MSAIGLLFGRRAIDFIKKTCGAHYRMMTASWEVNKKSIQNYITASTSCGKSSYRAQLPTLDWKAGERLFLQAFLVRTKHGEVKKKEKKDWGLTMALSVSTRLKKLKWTFKPKELRYHWKSPVCFSYWLNCECRQNRWCYEIICNSTDKHRHVKSIPGFNKETAGFKS